MQLRVQPIICQNITDQVEYVHWDLFLNDYHF